MTWAVSGGAPQPGSGSRREKTIAKSQTLLVDEVISFITYILYHEPVGVWGVVVSLEREVFWLRVRPVSIFKLVLVNEL